MNISSNFQQGAVVLMLLVSGCAHASGGAFVVDDAGIDDPGSCKIEAFSSFARKDGDLLVFAPACVVSLGVPVDVGLQIEHARGGGEWGLGLQAKTALASMNGGSFELALSGGVHYDTTAGETVAWFVNAPLTIQLAEPISVNVNAGVLRDRAAGRDYFTWGAECMLALSEPVTLIGEVFGQGSDDVGAQVGLRYMPHARIDFDLIYGHDLTGERSDWLTVGVNVRM